MAAPAEVVEELAPTDSNIALILLSPAAEMERGNIKASRISARIAAAIPPDAAEEVQLACAVEAIEKEDYQSWPEQWLIQGVLPAMLQTLNKLCGGDDLTQFQRSRYQELRESPDILQQITQGFTPILSIEDRDGFVHALVEAGFRRPKRGDEASAINEDGVLHVALSYKHAHSDYNQGKISRETAEEAYEIISNLQHIKKTPKVRVWVDQNLHRYPGHGTWHERGFIPYVALIVISALSHEGGFSLGRRRPWIWVETSLALRGRGVHCKKDICPSIRDLIAYPVDTTLEISNFGTAGRIKGQGNSVLDCIQSVLTAVSWWTPQILEHKQYPHEEDFQKFVFWARAQLMRVRSQDILSLNSRTCEDTMLEKLAWMKALPYGQSGRQVSRPPHLRIEGDIEAYASDLKLLKLSGKYVERGDVIEVIGDSVGFDVFCFKELDGKAYLDLIPANIPDNQRSSDHENFELHKKDLERMKQNLGGYSLWDPKFPRGQKPRYVICNTIFARHSGMCERFGELDENVSLGGIAFEFIGFEKFEMRLERVYESEGTEETRRRLCESDVLCIKDLGSKGESKFIAELMSDAILDSVSRIVKAQTGYPSRIRNPLVIGTSAEQVLDTLERFENQDRLEELEAETKMHVISISRTRLDDGLYMLEAMHDSLGQETYSFETSAVEEEMGFNLEHFKTSEDLETTLAKIRLMMGSTEFDGYCSTGLRLGIFVGQSRKGGEQYPTRFRLDGSEFRICPECGGIFSPVNTRLCALSTLLDSKEINIAWLDVHMCSTEGEELDITGLTC